MEKEVKEVKEVKETLTLEDLFNAEVKGLILKGSYKGHLSKIEPVVEKGIEYLVYYFTLDNGEVVWQRKARTPKYLGVNQQKFVTLKQAEDLINAGKRVIVETKSFNAQLANATGKKTLKEIMATPLMVVMDRPPFITRVEKYDEDVLSDEDILDL